MRAALRFRYLDEGKENSAMPNEPRAAKEKRTDSTRRPNAKSDHEGSAHSPKEFIVPAMEKTASTEQPERTGKDGPSKEA